METVVQSGQKYCHSTQTPNSRIASDRTNPVPLPQTLHLDNLSAHECWCSLLILSEDASVLYASANLPSFVSNCAEKLAYVAQLSRELRFIYQIAQQCRRHFTQQSWAMEIDILSKAARSLRIRSRWIKLAENQQSCLLIAIENQQQMLQEMLLDEVQNWGLTPREQEVWLLYQDGQTYNDIADQLVVSKNTIKKHMRSIHAKRRAADNP